MECRESSLQGCYSENVTNMDSRFPFPLHLPKGGTRQFPRLMFLQGFLIKMINELRIDKTRQMVFGLCIVVVKYIFHCRKISDFFLLLKLHSRKKV